MRKALVGALVVLVAIVPAATAKRAPRIDFAATALNVLPPGQSGSLAFPPNATDQAKLYDALTARFREVDGAYARDFKSEAFGVSGKAVRSERPRRGVTIVRDRWDVPHVYGATRADVEFGAGYATAEDRLLLMQLLRGPGRLAALDVPNVDPFAVAFAAQEFVPSAQTDALLSKQVAVLRAAGAAGRQTIRDIDAYLAGINAFIKAQGNFVPQWTRNDVIAIAALIAAQFGVGGGDEASRSTLLSALQARLGVQRGHSVFNDLRSERDPDTPVSVPGRAVSFSSDPSGAGNIVLDPASFSAAPVPTPSASNALLIAAKRSKTGHPLAVMGPQVGYAFPELLLEEDLHGGGIDARGAAFPGISFYILLGRGKDYAWSATSATNDIVDEFAETLCGGDDRHYLYKGECRAMDVIDAGVLKGKSGAPDREIKFLQTVHGPVRGYGTVGGAKVAIARDRSTRGREVLAALPFQALNTNRVHDARSFVAAVSAFELTFNWFYVDNRDIAMFSSGRVPVRAPGVDPTLPTKGTGEFDWRGFLPAARHPQAINPPSGTILNWNNKPAAGWPSADNVWSYQLHQRVELLRDALPTGKLGLADVVRAMNVAATQDLRAVEVWPSIAAVLATGPTSAHAAALASMLDAWQRGGGSRLDRDLDGKVDDPGAAVLDAAWPRIADAVLAPVLGPLTAQLAQVVTRSQNANPNGSSYAAGWYGYVDKDLRTLLGRAVKSPYSTRYCGAGDLAACRKSISDALDAAYDALAAEQGADPSKWRADASRERITFGLLPLTMRWANRPTFQQVITFAAHRPRR
jgi:acyl-homoserine lactone acylase PvdQ